MFFDLNEFWLISRRSNSAIEVPMYSLIDHINADVVDILPPVHTFTGCDTASKVGTKAAAAQHEISCPTMYILTIPVKLIFGLTIA